MPTIVGFLLVGFAAPAMAHASLVSTDPADGQVLEEPPAAVTVTFSEPIRLADTGNQLLDAAGEPVDADVIARDDTVVYTPAEPLADGSYIVSWRVISLDTHPVSGGMMFSVGHPSAGVAAGAIPSTDRQVDLLRQIAVALRYAGILGFAGLAWFWAFVAPRGARRADQHAAEVRRALRWLGATGIGFAVIAAPLATAWQNGYGLGDLLSPRLWWEAAANPATLTAALAIGGILAAQMGLRTDRRVPVAAGSAIALGALLVEGHTRTFGPAWVVLASDLTHVTAGALWFGGLIGLILTLLPRRDLRARDVALAVGRFSAAAMWLVAMLAVGGALLWWRIGGSIGGLWQSYYGELVLVKAGVVAAVVAVAAWNRFQLVPAVQAAAAVSPSSAAPALRRLRRTVSIEALALVAVLGVTGVLVTQQPPRPAAPASMEQTVTAASDDVLATITLRPGAVGTNALQLDLADSSGAPLAPAAAPTLSVTLVNTTVGPFRHPLSATGSGQYQAIVDFPLAGTWSIGITVRISEFSAPVLSTEVVIR